MQQKLVNSDPDSTKRRRERIRRERKLKKSADRTILPFRGFWTALLLLGIPTIGLGSLCFSLAEYNLRLNAENSELEEIATEVKAEIDSLGEEIDSLRERAGVSKSDDQPEQSPDKSADNTPESAQSRLAKNLPPRGGPAKAAATLDLLEDAREQIPDLTEALNLSVKPALEKTLAEESAYPDGPPIVGPLEVSSEFGIRPNPFGGSRYEVHEGIDFVTEQGDAITATGDGVVAEAGRNGGYGLSVTIDHGYGYKTLYAHMSEVKVGVGDRLKRGQVIGHVGSTGRSSGPHLHYSIYKNDAAINPRQLLKLSKPRAASNPQ